MSRGLKAGMFGLLGGALALGAGKAIGAVKDKIGDAEQEYIRYDALKRAMGDVNVSFDVLKKSLQAAAYDIDVTFAESQKLAGEFAKISGQRGDKDGTLAKDVAIGGGFSRSFGLDPSQGNQFMAQMRQFKATGNDADTRRMAIMIGEGIARSGAFSKADELMQAVAGYTANQTRQGLVTANVAGYTAMMAGMVKSGIPGLDPQGSAALLATINATIANGGGSEASQHMMYAALGNRHGLNPIQTKFLQEQGAFGTGEGAFGSPLYQSFAKKYNLTTPGASGNRSTNIQNIMNMMEELYSRDKGEEYPYLMLDAMKSALGTNLGQSMALATIGPQHLGGTMSRMSRLGIDPSKVAASGISILGQIESGDGAVLSGIIGSLRSRKNNPLSEEENSNLDKAILNANATGNDGPLRDILAELSASREQEETDGSRIREGIKHLDNTVMEQSAKLIGVNEAMRDGVLFLAAKMGAGPRGIQDAIRKAEEGERKEQAEIDLKKNYTRRNREITAEIRDLATQRSAVPLFSPERKEIQAKIDALRAERNGLLSGFVADKKALDGSTPSTGGATPGTITPAGPQLDVDKIKSTPTGAGTVLRRTSASGGSSDALFRALLHQESRGRHYNGRGGILTSPAGARGIAQIMPATGMNPGFGLTPLQDDSKEENLRLGREYLDAMLKEFGGDQSKALAAYNAGHGSVKRAVRRHGDNWLAHMPAETRNYVSSINGAVSETAMPEGGSAGKSASSPLKFEIEGNFTLNGNDGKAAAPPINMMKRVAVPTPFGMMGR